MTGADAAATPQPRASRRTRYALIASLAVGITDTFGRMVWPQVFGELVGNIVANSAVYILMALVIAIRPAGLFGTQGH